MKRYRWILAWGMLLPALSVAGQSSLPSPISLADDLARSQDWLVKAKSLYVRYDFDDVPAKPGAAEVPAHPPAATAPAPNDQQVAPASTTRKTALAIGFDKERSYLLTQTDWFGQVIAWDGKVCTTSAKEGVYQRSNTSPNLKSMMLLRDLWGHNGPSSPETGMDGGPEQIFNFVRGSKVTGTENFHGVDCYVLKNERPFPRPVPGVEPAFIVTSYIGVKDHRLYGFSENFEMHRFADYVEVAPGAWLPTIHIVARQMEAGGPFEDKYRMRLKDVKIDEGLPAKLFEEIIPEGAQVHDTRGGVARDYVWKAERTAAEWDEIEANAARSKVYGPPLLDPGKGIMLGSRADPLPLNPLALAPAADFPANAKWLNDKPQKLATLHGKVVLVFFWASWQDFSGRPWPRQTLPPDYKLPENLKKDVVLIGVHVPTIEPERVQNAIDQHEFGFPICIDVPMDKAPWGKMADQYRLDQLPTVYVIDQEGYIAALGDWPEAVRRAGELLPKPAEAGKAAP